MNKLKWTGMVIGLAAVLLTPLVGAAIAAPPTETTHWLGPRISIVWPHNGGGTFTSVANSKAVNVSVWPSNAVSCVVITQYNFLST